MNRPRLIAMFAALALLAASDGAAIAQEAEAPIPARDGPVLLLADDVYFDDELGIVIARGSVELVQEPRSLTADTVTYTRATGVVTATGNVTLVEPNGSVGFFEYVELQDELREGFVQRVSVLLADNARLAAQSGTRSRNGERTDLDYAVYSPCDLCPNDPEAPPIWQLRARRVVQDDVEEEVIFRDAFLEFFGVPLIYTPYLSQPAPNVERRTGFLIPTAGRSSDLGGFGIVPYYWNIAPNQDLTAYLTATTERGSALRGQYRQALGRGQFNVDTSVNYSERFEADVPSQRRDDIRGHFFSDFVYHIDENFRSGFQIQRVTDDSYLDQFSISDDDILTSRAYLEYFSELDYGVMEVIGSQDLRADAAIQPTVLPSASYSHVHIPPDPFGGQMTLDASLLSLNREDHIIDFSDASRLGLLQNTDVIRGSLALGWERDWHLPHGLVAFADTDLRGDVYLSQNVRSAEEPGLLLEEDTAARLHHAARLGLRYPLVRQATDSQQLVEPLTSLTYSEATSFGGIIPNNDSVEIGFDETNLLVANRSVGVDRIDQSTRFNYGLNLGHYSGGIDADLFVGQTFNIEAGNREIRDGTNVDDDLSDLVARLNVTTGWPEVPVTFDWRVRYDLFDEQIVRNQLVANASYDPVSLGINYLFFDDGIIANSTRNREEMTVRGTVSVAEYWQLRSSWTYDLDQSVHRTLSTGLGYADECFVISLDVRRDFTQDRDRDDGVTVLLNISLATLGGFPTSFKVQ